MTNIRLDQSRVQTKSDLSQDDNDLIEYEKNEAKRIKKRENFLYFCIQVFVIFIIVLISSACVVTYFWNTLAPHDLRWLPPAEVEQFKNFTISIVSGVLTAIFIKLFVKL